MNDTWKNQLIIELDLINDLFIEYFTIQDECDGYNDGCYKLNGPTVIHNTGDKEWYINDNSYNFKGLVFIGHKGYKEWWTNDKLIKVIEYE